MGSACAAGAVEPSHVLLAMGLSRDEARSSLRLSLGWSTTADEIERAAEIIARVWRRVRAAEPLTAAASRRDGRRGRGHAMSARVLVAMSGGVDSSVAAAILCERGYDVVGVAMRLAPEDASAGGCASRARVARTRISRMRAGSPSVMDFPFYVVDLRAEFGARVIDNFVSEYLRRPHAQSVRDVQSRDQVRPPARARRGARRRLRRDRPLCPYRARFARPLPSAARRRSPPRTSRTFCSRSARPELARTLFPLGAMTKAEVRARARAARSRERRQAREPGDLLRARRRLCPLRRARVRRPSVFAPGTSSIGHGTYSGGPCRSASFHGRTAPRTRT